MGDRRGGSIPIKAGFLLRLPGLSEEHPPPPDLDGSVATVLIDYRRAGHSTRPTEDGMPPRPGSGSDQLDAARVIRCNVGGWQDEVVRGRRKSRLVALTNLKFVIELTSLAFGPRAGRLVGLTDL